MTEENTALQVMDSGPALNLLSPAMLKEKAGVESAILSYCDLIITGELMYRRHCKVYPTERQPEYSDSVLFYSINVLQKLSLECAK